MSMLVAIKNRLSPAKDEDDTARFESPEGSECSEEDLKEIESVELNDCDIVSYTAYIPAGYTFNGNRSIRKAPKKSARPKRKRLPK